MKNKMTIKKALKKIDKLTNKLIKADEVEMDILERKINLLRDYIYFKTEFK